MKRFALLLLTASLCFTTSAIAADKRAKDKFVGDQEKLQSKTYSPDYCEFSATFPEVPYVTHRCEDDSKEKCYDLVSYTKVFDLSSTVKVEIICNPSSPEMYDQLTLDVMKSTVRAMTRGSVIESYDVQGREEAVYRQAGLLGKARSGVHDSIYISQLWSGKKSMMSVEAQLIGEPREDADQLFAEILRSIGHMDSAETAEEEAQEEQTAPSDEKEKDVKPTQKSKP